MNLLNPDKIREFVEKNPKLVTRRESIKHPGLYVIKYTRKVFYDNLWAPELMEMRGLVVDKDYNVVIYPFTKIFNRGENGTDFPLDAQVDVIRKVNGFMACVTQYNGKNVVSTTGSLDSDFVVLAEKWVGNLNIHAGFTYMFEICDPSDPHIIKEVPGAYLIGMRNLDTFEMMPEDYLDLETSKLEYSLLSSPKRPIWFQYRFSDVLELVKICKHEGFVVRLGDESLKIKSPYYLVTKFLARMKQEKFLEKISNPNELKETIDEEFYGLVDHLYQIKEYVASLDDQGRISLIENYFGEKNAN